jgi:hypothetical protein
MREMQGDEIRTEFWPEILMEGELMGDLDVKGIIIHKI